MKQRRALILGGDGQIGRALSSHLVLRGWDVTCATRSRRNAIDGARCVIADASNGEAIREALSPHCDLLISAVAFDENDAKVLSDISHSVGRLVAISSASVYRDEFGRTLDEAGDSGFPAFKGPIEVTHPTVDPAPETYSTRKIAMERTLLGRCRCPVTILRPCAIHGAYSRHAREWWFVKRILDNRSHVPLAYGGRSRFQTTSTQAIATAVLRSLADESTNIWNVVDADSPTVAEIGATIAKHFGVRLSMWTPTETDQAPSLGRTPWSIPLDVIPVNSGPIHATYAETVGPALDWLASAVPVVGWEKHLPQLAAYPLDLFDYAAEDLNR